MWYANRAVDWWIGDADDAECFPSRWYLQQERHTRRSSLKGNHQRRRQCAHQNPVPYSISLPELAANAVKAKAAQTELAYTSLSLRTVTAAVEIYYDPDPSTAIIEEDREFVDAFFVSPDDDTEANQSSWLLRLELADRSKTPDRKLGRMNYVQVAGRIAECFKRVYS